MRFALLFVLLCGCSSREDSAPTTSPPAVTHAAKHDAPKPTGKVYLSTPSGELAVDVEVVATEATIERGLMYRQQLAENAGMLFLMGTERDWSFWMRNTLIPLDMLFIGKDMTVVGIVENAEPLTESLRTVGKPSFYVLEVNGGWSKQHGVTAGAKARFENVSQN